MKKILGAILASLALSANAQWPTYTTPVAGAAAIGAAVSGGTANSVLFVGSTGLLAEGDLTYNDTTKRFQVGSGSGATTTGFLIGNYGFSGSYAALWITAVTAASGNYALAVNATETRLNAPTGGQVFAGVNGTAVVTVSSSSITAAQPILVPNGSGGGAALGFSTQPTSGLIYVNSADWRLMSAGADVMAIRTYTGDAASFRDKLSFNTAMGSGDLFLVRDAANTLAQRNGANAQMLKVGNTYTDASNGEWGAFGFESNVLKIGARANGTGTVRVVDIVGSGLTVSAITPASSGTRYVCIDTAGAISSSASACSGT